MTRRQQHGRATGGPGPKAAKALIMITAIGAASVGCGTATGPEPRGPTLVLAATAVATEQRPALTSAARAEVAAALGTDRARLRIVISGPDRARVLEDGDLRLRRGTQVEHDTARRAELTRQEVLRIDSVLGAAAGQAPQLDLAGLLDVIARTPGPGTAVVISSGVQTAGPLAIAALGWDRVGSDEVVEQAKRDGLVPDLRGKRVVLSGIGEVHQPQEALPPPLRDRLARMWLRFCQAGGGDCTLDGEPLVGGEPRSTAAVPTVPVPHPPVLTAQAAAGPVELPSDILFWPDSADLLPDADPLLAQVAKALPAGSRIRLIGRTASVGPAESARALSLRRAGAVRDGLTARGVPAPSLSVEGLGYDRPLVADRDAAGAFIPAAAQRNRSVELVVTRP
ncbi:outer membrane protein OmpA-like peptidoglycan-associated protein [Actinokineospora baliensis]|uniref:OmpA family protein n=1 Tax=Actinokineospora baliensis TaxID=547056 RepID=UPI00195DA357|nr:OmpA family protein [Actinokineospora baliensis]MBM7769929.1 outer membrane protein OmpA-like peptidoglycan-associated protein [Actinokineospora baliensis]